MDYLSFPRSASRPLLGALFLLAVILTACGDDVQQATTVQIAVTPEPVSFSQTVVGETATQSVTISSVSDGILTVSGFTYEGDDVFSVEGLIPVQLHPGDTHTFEVVYAPGDGGASSGRLVLETNAQNQSANEIRITSEAGFSELIAEPDPVIISTDRIGEEYREEVTLRGRGGVPFEIIDIREFSPWAELVLSENPVPVGGDPLTISPAQDRDETAFTLSYTPTEAREFTAEVVVRCTAENCGDNQRIVIPVEVTSIAGELLVEPDPIDFGAVPYDEPADQVVTMSNLGAAPLTVEEAFLRDRETGDEDPADVSITTFAGGTYDRDASTVEIAAGEEQTLVVQYLPTQPEGVASELVVRSNDPVASEIVIPIDGLPAAPILSIEPQEIVFGTIARTITARTRLRLRNIGAGELTIGSLVSPREYPTEDFGANDFSFALDHDTLDEEEIIDADGTATGERGYNDLVIAAGEEMDFTVAFRVGENAPLFQEFVDVIQVLDTNDPRLSGIETVPINGRIGDEPECELVVTPNPMDFGLLIRGETAERVITVRNAGSGNCVVRNSSIMENFFSILPGNGDYFNYVEAIPIGFYGNTNEILAPGEEFLAVVQYSPETISPFGENLGDQAYLTLDIRDQFTGDTMTCGTPNVIPPLTFPPTSPPDCAVNLRGQSGVATLATIPGGLNTGPVTLGCSSQVEDVTVYSIGSAPVELEQVFLDGCDGRFQLLNTPNLPRTMDPNDSFSMQVRYTPNSVTQTDCRILFTGSMEGGQHSMPLRGRGTEEITTVDEFTQNDGREVDVLFVTDNSGSMGDLQNNLDSNINTFIQQAELLDADFQFGVVTTQTEGRIPHDNFSGRREPGELMGNPRIITPTTSNYAQQFRDTLLVGVNNESESAIERGFESARLALTDPLVTHFGDDCSSCPAPYSCVNGSCGGYNRGFLRDGAALQLIFFSDEEEQSRASFDFYLDLFTSLKGAGNEDLFSVHAITGPRDRCCGSGNQCESGGQPGEVGSADPAPRYVDMTEATGGVWGNICSPSFADTLEEIGEGAFAEQQEFFLSRIPDPSTIVVQIDGAGAPSVEGTDYDYRAQSNSIRWRAGAIPEPGTAFTVTYDAACL